MLFAEIVGTAIAWLPCTISSDERLKLQTSAVVTFINMFRQCLPVYLQKITTILTGIGLVFAAIFQIGTKEKKKKKGQLTVYIITTISSFFCVGEEIMYICWICVQCVFVCVFV